MSTFKERIEAEFKILDEKYEREERLDNARFQTLIALAKGRPKDRLPMGAIIGIFALIGALVGGLVSVGINKLLLIL